MMVNDITAQAGRNKSRKRVGRGESSGLGKTSGRGHKGCHSRSGGGTRKLTEGGQMPLFRRLPKRGFNNANFATRFEVVNLGDLAKRFSDGETAGVEQMRDMRLIQGRNPLVKVLAKGKLDKKLTVEAHAFSEAARKAVEAAGGSVKQLERLDQAQAARAKRKTAKPSESTRGKRLAKKNLAKDGQKDPQSA